MARCVACFERVSTRDGMLNTYEASTSVLLADMSHKNSSCSKGLACETGKAARRWKRHVGSLVTADGQNLVSSIKYSLTICNSSQNLG